jgi:hypothetical protein
MKSTRTAVAFLFPLVVIAASCAHAADGVPTFNVNASCTAQAAVAPERKAKCLSDEQSARSVLERQWQTFGAADKQVCTETATIGGAASYVELLTCLQMDADARKLPANRKQ